MPFPARLPRHAVAVAAAAAIMLLAMLATDAHAALRYGGYPWGAVGATTTIAPSVPDDANKALAAAKALKGTRSFTIQSYASYTGTDGTASADAMMNEVTWWSANGFRIAAVLRYRPAKSSYASGYTSWATALAKRLAGVKGVASIQVANEPNNPASGAGDGAYAGVIEAIARTVPAVRTTVVNAGRSDIRVGLNYAAGNARLNWEGLKLIGGSAFDAAVGFVGVNIYPGTWSSPSASTAPTQSAFTNAFSGEFAKIRTDYMPAAGIPSGVPIQIPETGYPTSSTRSEAWQANATAYILSAVASLASSYNVTDLRWFSARDGNTASGQLENGYGLQRDNYTNKPAFSTFQSYIANYGL